MIFLDFDGVLYDTVREAYTVSVLTNNIYKSIDEIDYNTTHYELFKKMRYLISPAWNYKYLLEGLDHINDIYELKRFYIEKIEKATKEDYKDFERSFFQTRTILKKQNYEKWFRLNIPFPFLSKIEYLFYEYKEKLYIVTTKDKSTVLKLLDLENIEFNPDRIYDKVDYEKYGNKKNIIEFLLSKEKGIFIDDSDKHVKDCSSIENLQCLQPDWGYVGLDSKTVSHKEIIKEINKLIGQGDYKNV